MNRRIRLAAPTSRSSATQASEADADHAILGEEVAPTGVGEPVTMDEHLYIHRSGFLGLLDTRGLKIGKDTDELISELRRLPEEDAAAAALRADPGCLARRPVDRPAVGGHRSEFICRLHALALLVVAVLTQVPSRGGEYPADALTLADHVAGLHLPIVGGRPILVMSTVDEFTGQVQHGLRSSSMPRFAQLRRVLKQRSLPPRKSIWQESARKAKQLSARLPRRR